MSYPKDMNDYAYEAHRNSKAHGFWEGEDPTDPHVLAAKLCLIRPCTSCARAAMSTDSPSRIIANLQHERDELRAEVERLRKETWNLGTRGDEAEEELAKLREERQPLLDLLAVCNQDGGHYAERYGIKRAVRQARLTVERLLANAPLPAPPGEKGE